MKPDRANHTNTRLETNAGLSIPAWVILNVTPPVVVVLLIVLGWYFVARQTQALTQAIIAAYQQTGLEIVRATARSVEWFVYDQTGVQDHTDVTEVEQAIFERFIAPIRLLERGDAWIHTPDHIVFDLSADFPDEYRNKSMAQVFAIQAQKGASHYEEMTDAVMHAREGVGWYIWLPDKGKEIAAWTPVRVGDHVWTIGLSTPLPEILDSTGAAAQIRASITVMAVATVTGLGLLIARARNTVQRQRAEELARVQRDMGLALGAAVGLDETLRLCVEGALRATGMECGGIYLVDNETGVLDLAFQIGLSNEFVRTVARYDADTPSARLVMAGEPVYSRYQELNVPLDVPPGGPRLHEGLKATAIVPVLYEGRTVACLNVASRQHDKIPVIARSALEAIASQVGNVIARARAEETLRQRNRELALLSHAGQTLNSTLDLGQVLVTVLDEVRRLLGVVACSVWLIDPQTDELVCRQASDPFGKILCGWRLAPGVGLAGWAAHSGESLIVPDAQVQERHFKGIDRQTGLDIHSLLSIPLRVRENVIGVLEVVDTEIDRFDVTHLSLLEPLAASAATAIENARLFVATRRQAEQLEALRQVSQDLTALRDRDTLLQNIVERAIELLGADSGGMYLYYPERQVLEWVVAVAAPASTGEKLQPRGFTLERGEGLAGKVWSTGKPLTVDDYDNWPGRASKVGISGARAVIGVPVQWGDEFMGVLTIRCDDPGRRFTTQDTGLLSQFATQAAIAIQNVRLYEQAQQEIAERKRMEKEISWEAGVNAIIAELSRMLIQTASLEDISFLVLEHARRLTGSEFGFVGYIDPQTGYLVCPAATRAVLNARPVEDKGIVFETFDGLWGWVLENRKPLLTNRPENDPRSLKTPPDHAPIHRFLSVPASVGGTLVGQVALANAERDYVEQDLALVERLASLYGLAIQSRRTMEELRQRNEELMFLNAIATTIGQSLDLDHMLNATLDMVVEVSKMDAGWLYLLDGKENGDLLSLVARRGIPEEIANRAKTIRLGEGLTGRVARLRRPIVETRPSNSPGFSTETQGWRSLHTAAGVPIQAKDKVLGVLSVFSRSPHELHSQEMHLLTAVGHQIGMAIENVRLVEEAADIEILRELDRLRSELVANVSHELRTPLGLIKILCTTLLREDVDFDHETRQEFLSGIEEETENLEKIVDNLLDLSRMGEGRLRLVKCPTDVGQLAGGVMESMEVQLVQHCFVHDFPSKPLVATVDPKRIEQVLRNLLTNAIKYSPEGGHITVQGRGDHRQLLIQVRDEGMGIPPEDLERVFERFYRVENEITQRVGGVGLGLAVCRAIVEAHGGRMWVESSLGVRSTFFFALPAKE